MHEFDDADDLDLPSEVFEWPKGPSANDLVIRRGRGPIRRGWPPTRARSTIGAVHNHWYS